MKYASSMINKHNSRPSLLYVLFLKCLLIVDGFELVSASLYRPKHRDSTRDSETLISVGVGAQLFALKQQTLG